MSTPRRSGAARDVANRAHHHPERVDIARPDDPVPAAGAATPNGADSCATLTVIAVIDDRKTICVGSR